MRPKNATPSWISVGCGENFRRKTSPSGWPEPTTGTRSSSPARAKLVAELVDLGDRLLEVALVDLVGGHGGWHEDWLNLPR